MRNGAAGIEKCISSLLRQTYSNLELIVSDNNSEDRTWELINSFASNDGRVQPRRCYRNIGAFNNFKLCSAQACGDYIMAAAHDDVWSETFIEENLNTLEANNRVVASIGKVTFVERGIFRYDSNGDYSIDGSVRARLKDFFSIASDNSRFYSLFRAKVFEKAMSFEHPFHAADWYFSARSLLYGAHTRVETCGITREVPEVNRYTLQVKQDNAEWPFFLRSPLGPMIFKIITTFPLSQSIQLMPQLWRLNRKKIRDCRSLKKKISVD